MIHSGSIRPHRLPFLMLSLVILSMGCAFVDPDIISNHHPSLDIQRLQRQMIATVETNFLKIFDSLTIECAQLGSLLTTYWGFYGNIPIRAEIILGAALKAALALQLNSEPAWGNIDPIQREIRKRCWISFCVSETYVVSQLEVMTLLTLYRFVAVNCGRPSLIRESHWNLSKPRVIDDVLKRCPSFHSTELLEDGSQQYVTVMTYQTHKFDLYKIMSDIIGIFYHQRGRTSVEIIREAKDIKHRLVAWESRLPPELRLASFRIRPSDPENVETLRIFSVQALALQVLYYNAKILLYRPFLAPRVKHLNHTVHQKHGVPGAVGGAAVEDVDLAFYQTCRNECWSAAFQTTRLIEYDHVLRWSGRTPVAPFFGMHSFTTAAVLCLFAVASPPSATAQDAKRGLGNLVQLIRIMDSPNKLCRQSADVTKSFLQLVLSEEMKVLTSGSLPPSGRVGLGEVVDENVEQPGQSLQAPRLDLNAAGNGDVGTRNSDLAASTGGVDADHVMFGSRVSNSLESDAEISIDALGDAFTAIQSGKSFYHEYSLRYL